MTARRLIIQRLGCLGSPGFVRLECFEFRPIAHHRDECCEQRVLVAGETGFEMIEHRTNHPFHAGVAALHYSLGKIDRSHWLN